MDNIIDYSDAFLEALLAQGRGRNMLILHDLGDEVRKRFDGKHAHYELVYRWLSIECQHSRDQAWACVEGSEVTLWQAREIRPLLNDLKKHGDACLFDHFNLF